MEDVPRFSERVWLAKLDAKRKKRKPRKVQAQKTPKALRHSYKPVLLARADEMRERMTKAEAALWAHLRLWEAPFLCRAQHVINYQIADFSFPAQHLVVEVDGGYHVAPAQKARDKERTAKLRKHGFNEIRFTNEQVLRHMERVLTEISARLGRAWHVRD